MEKIIKNTSGIQYRLEYKQVKHINLHIATDASVYVSAPFFIAFEKIDRFITQKAAWIQAHQAIVLKQWKAQPSCLLFTGKPLYLLGELYHAELTHSAAIDIYIPPGTHTIKIQAPSATTADILYTHYMQFLKRQAVATFPEIVTRMHLCTTAYGVQKPQLFIRNMKTRWGSCTMAKHRIRLNLQLIKMPVAAIEQVALHELVHFIHPNHSPAFYALLKELMPDYQARRALLGQFDDGMQASRALFYREAQAYEAKPKEVY